MKDYLPASNLLADRVILVTGATQGMGREVALAAAQHGATVVLLARGVRRLENVYDEILAAGGPEPAAIPLDLQQASDSDFDALALKLFQTFGRLDGIVHCAAHFYGSSPLANQTIEEWMNQFRINTVAPFALTRACLPLLKKAEDASVVLVGETHGIKPGPFWGGFAVSKCGLSHLTQIAANEWDAHPNLRINLIVPGPVASPMRTRTHPGESKSSLPTLDSLIPDFLYWLGPDSRGRSGEIIELNP